MGAFKSSSRGSSSPRLFCLALLLLISCLVRASSFLQPPAPLPLTPAAATTSACKRRNGVAPSSLLHHLPSPATPLRSVASPSSSSALISQHDDEEVMEEARGIMVSKKPMMMMAKGGAATAKAMWAKSRVWVLIALWYYFNIYFNIYNKKVLNVFPMPWSVSVAQLGIGSLYALFAWAVRMRRVPTIAKEEAKTLSVLSVFHAISHITAITSLMAGAVSFTHIVKSAEPFFSALFAGMFFRQFFHPLVYAALVPVVGGVAYASVKELTFTWLSFSCAMASNVVCAARGVVVKGMMGGKPTQSKDLGSSNMYAVLTIQATLMLLPFMLVFEARQLPAAWSKAAELMPGGVGQLSRQLAYSGLTFYFYNEVAFAALESLHPISHAVVNTIKRVVIIAVSVLVFRNPMSTQSVIGSAVAVLGVLAYSLAKHYCPKK